MWCSLPPGVDMGNMDAAARAAEKAAYVRGLEQRLLELKSYEDKHQQQQQNGSASHKQQHHQQQPGATEEQQQQQQQEGSTGQGPAKRTKRVSFADEVEGGAGGSSSSTRDEGRDLQQQVQAMAFGRGRGGSRQGRGEGPSTSGRGSAPAALPPTRAAAAAAGGGGRGWGRGRRGGRGIPDHVLHPHKYTVYTLDEPLLVGGGDADDEDEVGWKVSGLTTAPGHVAGAHSPQFCVLARHTAVHSVLARHTAALQSFAVLPADAAASDSSHCQAAQVHGIAQLQHHALPGNCVSLFCVSGGA